MTEQMTIDEAIEIIDDCIEIAKSVYPFSEYKKAEKNKIKEAWDIICINLSDMQYGCV